MVRALATGRLKKEKIGKGIKPGVEFQNKHLFWGRVGRFGVGSITWSFVGERKEGIRQYKLKILHK